MTPDPVERIELLETMLAALVDHIDAVGCYDAQGERLSDQVPVVRQAAREKKVTLRRRPRM